MKILEIRFLIETLILLVDGLSQTGSYVHRRFRECDLEFNIR